MGRLRPDCSALDFAAVVAFDWTKNHIAASVGYRAVSLPYRGYGVCLPNEAQLDSVLCCVLAECDWSVSVFFYPPPQTTHSPECQDVLKFVSQWCGGLPTTGFSFH